MIFWWLDKISRATHERAQLAKLAEQKDWIKNLSITLGDGNLAAQFDIEHGSDIFELILTYPVVFPDVPPLVKTRGGKRISGHQYGANGELCLEYRPDNWVPDVTGAMMIESAFKLLSGENPHDESEVSEIMDGHVASIGQMTRTAHVRFVVTSEDIAALQSLKENVVYSGVIGRAIQDKKHSTRIMHIDDTKAQIWNSQSRFSEQCIKSDVFIIKNPKTALPRSPTSADIMACINSAKDDAFNHELIEEKENFYLLVSEAEAWSLHWFFSNKGEASTFPWTTILDVSQGRRLPEQLEVIRDKKVGIIGCGSLGSKIAMHLTRSKVGSFLLIDDDVFFESNLCRNELAVPDIGFHKARALRSRLLSVNPNLTVETRQIKLGGQESSETTVSAMRQLAECDLIVDATAAPAAFNIIAAVCKKEKIPVVWGSVFAGGIGGIVGRALPDIDPEPLDARQQTRRWCEEQGVEAPQSSNDNTAYEALGADGQPVIATDADVSVIAAHVARFAIDTLIQPEDGVFPYSAYVIGLSRNWIFSAPFDTRPIIYTNQKEWTSDVEKIDPDAVGEFLKGILPVEVDSGS